MTNLVGRVGLSRTQVVRWQVGGVPEKHRARVRRLLPPAPKVDTEVKS
jgi:hypothetical protein